MKATLSILTLPQRWENNKLTLRALVIPRNLDPTIPGQIAPGTPAWCHSKLALRVRLISDPEKYPSILEPDKIFPMTGVSLPVKTADIFKEMVSQLGGIKSAARLEKTNASMRARKYLPESYRNSFNFITPRTSDAAIDDSYHCAIKYYSKPDPTFKSSVDSLSWGKVFGYCLRQPALAKRVGFIYEATLDVDPVLLKDGGWLYVDLDDGASYKPAMDADQQIVKRYAARMPKLKGHSDRPLFAAVQFPVLIKAVPDPTDENDPIQPGDMDDLLIEAEQYADGFCKIVHANQPVSSNLLLETEDKELPVITEAGIRLAWDDEQLLIWMNRQMKQDPTLAPGRRMDAPMGVIQYRVDVRLSSDAVPNPNPWIPLCKVRNISDLMIGTTVIDNAENESEPGVEVYPSQLDARKDEPFWLPQYFANWLGKSLVLTDTDAIDIFRKEDNTLVDPKTGIAKKAKKYKNYKAAGLDKIQLTYGTKYDFRVRLADITGGGPDVKDKRIYAAPAPEGFCDFRRWVQPQTVRLRNVLPEKDDEYFTGKVLSMQRPLLGYRAVLFTEEYANGKYDEAITNLKADRDKSLTEKREFGLPDPDVGSVEVVVEVKALGMDMLLRYNTDSRDNYARLYVTRRKFPPAFDGTLDIPVKFVDAPVLNFTDSQDLGELGLVAGGDDIDLHKDIVLPTSRDIRITLRPVLDDKTEYYADSDLPEKGKPVTFITRKAAADETALFKATDDVDRIRGIWLQPDTDTYLRANLGEVFVENYLSTNSSSMMERLADAISKSIPVETKGLALLGKQGARVQFGVSRFIRHSMSPDSTNITFSTKSDLLNHWIIPVTLLLNRDWTWDGAMPVSFDVYRQKKFVGAGLPENVRDHIPWGPEEHVGDIEMKQVINIQALYEPDRSQTYLCFIDALEPKPSGPVIRPEEIMVKYRIQANFKSLPDSVSIIKDKDVTVQLHLPITTRPGQVPKIVSAGIAQSIYISDDAYSSTEPRQRYLWVEFDQPLENPDDSYFIRQLAYSPDPLLAQWAIDMLKAPEEPSLAIDPEPIRTISPDHTDDRSGLNAMTELIKAQDSQVHYLVPLPPGLHAASPELFGFFTYELRVGHKIGWSTAQGRFGRALRTTGVQHPAPQLYCVVNRNEKHIMVTAPYAQTVYSGADVTAKPPRTQLWALLYAQVKRADDKVYRNVLLDDQILVRQRTAQGKKGQPAIVMNTDAVQNGITGWKNKHVIKILQSYGLAPDSSLSVLVVEMLPTYDKFFTRTIRTRTAESFSGQEPARITLEEGMEIRRFTAAVSQEIYSADDIQQEMEKEFYDKMEELYITESEKQDLIRPLTDHLGSERILRTSTLVPVPSICLY